MSNVVKAASLVFPLELTCEYPMISTLSALTSLNASNAFFTVVVFATVLLASVPTASIMLIDVILLSAFLASKPAVFTSIFTELLSVESKVVYTSV